MTPSSKPEASHLIELQIPPPGPAVGSSFLLDYLEANSLYSLRKPRNNSNREKGSFKIETITRAFIEHFTLERTLFITMSFPHGTTPLQAAKTMKRPEKVLAKYFEAYVWVLVIKRHLNPHTNRSYRTVHVHMVAAAHQDIRTGTDFEVFERYRAIQNTAKKEHRRLTPAELAECRAMVKLLTSNKALKALWSELRKKLPKLGFAHRLPFEALPVEKNAQAIASYMAKNFRESDSAKHVSDGKLHLWGASQNAPTPVGRIDSFSLLTVGTIDWRHHVALAAGSVGITNLGQMGKEYGSRWCWKMRRVVKWMNECIQTEGSLPALDAIRDKMIEVMGEPLSSQDLRTDAEKTWADIRAELIRMAPMRAAVLADQQDFALAS